MHARAQSIETGQAFRLLSWGLDGLPEPSFVVCLAWRGKEENCIH